MFGRLLRLRFDKQGTLKTGFVFVLNHQLHETANLLAFLTQIGIKQRFVAFTTAPQNIVLAA
ncbi:hypothetical protein D3C81_2214480 [compost metagenome]